MLIGADVSEIFLLRNLQKRLKGTLYAIETPLEWSLLSPSMFSSQANYQVNFLSCKDDELLQAIECLWNSNVEKGTLVSNVSNSKEGRAAYNLMASRLSRDQEHYQLLLL